MVTINKLIQIINNIHIFRIITLIVNITYVVPSSLDIENIPMKIVFVWGIYLIIKDFFTKRVMFSGKYWYILVALALSFGISVILNYPYQFPVTLYNWVYVMHALFLFYPFNLENSMDDTNKWVKRFNDVLIVYVFVLTSISLLTFVFNVQFWAMSGTGFWQRQGFMENRLFGLYSSPNVGATLGVLSVVSSIVNNLLQGRKWNGFSKIYFLNLVVQYLYFILSSSRGTTIVILSIAGLLFLYGYIYLIRNKEKIKLKIGNYIVFGILSFFLVYSVSSSVKGALSYVPSSVQVMITAVTSIPDYLSNKPLGEKELEESLDNEMAIKNLAPIVIQHSDDSAEFSSGRLTIWEAALAATKQRPYFGLADSDLYRNMQDYEVTSQVDMSELTQYNRSELKRSAGNMHNTYISAIIHSGIIGTVLLFLFAVIYFIDHIKNIFSKSFNLKDSKNQVYILLIVTIISLLVLDLVENHVIYKPRDPMGLIFWVYAGYLNVIKYNKMGKS